jgi:hypothetical protein
MRPNARIDPGDPGSRQRFPPHCTVQLP